MFEVLNNTESNIDELVGSYVKAAAMEETLKASLEQAYRTLMDLQKHFLDPERKDSKELKEARLQYDDCSVKLESCRFGMGQIRDRMIERLPVESQNRRSDIRQEITRLKEKRKDLRRSYLRKVAEAIVIDEEINGIAVTVLPSTGELRESGFRDTKLDRLSTEDAVFLREEVKRRRQTNCKPIDAGIRKLLEEDARIEELLESDDGHNTERIEQIIQLKLDALRSTPPVLLQASS